MIAYRRAKRDEKVPKRYCEGEACVGVAGPQPQGRQAHVGLWWTSTVLRPSWDTRPVIFICLFFNFPCFNKLLSLNKEQGYEY